MSFINPINESYCLEKICESNYEKLLKLLPHLLLLKDKQVGYIEFNAGIQITLLSVSTYTLTLELNHCFNISTNDYVAPSIQIRLYLDLKLVEVLSDHERAQVHKIYKDPSLSYEIIRYKWKLNFFLQKWLDHCLYKQKPIENAA